MFKYDPCSKGVEEDLHKDETERKKKKNQRENPTRKGKGKERFRMAFRFLLRFQTRTEHVELLRFLCGSRKHESKRRTRGAFSKSIQFRFFLERH